jgi:VanZ family protein
VIPSQLEQVVESLGSAEEIWATVSRCCRATPPMEERIQRILRVTIIFFLLSLVVFAKFTEPTRFAHTLQKLAHPVTFGAIALLFLTLLRNDAPSRLRSYVVAFALTVVCGAGTEVAQAFVARDPSLLDVLRDALGASTALAAFATLIPGADARGRGAWRVMGALFAIMGLAIMAAPISISLAAYAHRDLQFPTLIEACSPLDRYFLSGDVKVVQSTGLTASRCGSALRVEFGNQHGGMSVDEPFPDWRAVHTLVLDLRNPGETDLSLVLRVHDRAHNYQFQDRFNREFTLRARERLEIAIPIADIEHAPAGRLMDLSQITGIILFRYGGLMVGNFEVERILLRR